MAVVGVWDVVSDINRVSYRTVCVPVCGSSNIQDKFWAFRDRIEKTDWETQLGGLIGRPTSEEGLGGGI